ncbi:hypothetical protein wCauATS_14270 [Wolbachia pipientis]
MRELTMDRIACLSKDLNEFFNEKADEISIAVGFIKRKRKLNGSSFIKAMVFGNIGVDDCSIETMCQLLNEDSIEITKQGLDFRFSEEAVEFMKKMYNEALCLFKKVYRLIAKFYSNLEALNYWIAATLACPVAWKICTKDMAVAIEIVRIIPNQE